MSWATCYSGSNNFKFNFPPIMSDGRNYASWQPDAVVNKRIQDKAHINNNWTYRQYLQNNGIAIMKYNSGEACYNLGLPTHVHTGKTPSSNVPFMYKSSFDSRKPGYGYCSSDLKNPYLSREQLNSRIISPSITISPSS